MVTEIYYLFVLNIEIKISFFTMYHILLDCFEYVYLKLYSVFYLPTSTLLIHFTYFIAELIILDVALDVAEIAEQNYILGNHLSTLV